jgi:phenol hydroxylase P3 protein
MAVRQRTLLQNPKHFVAPGHLNFEKHFRLHQQEKTRYYAELARLTDDQRNLRTVTPGYVEGITPRWIALYHGEVAAAQYMGAAAHSVPINDYWDFIACCVCQQTDELQHSEMDRDMLFRAGLTENDMRTQWAESAARPVFDHLLGLDDGFEIAFKGGFVLESANAVVGFHAMARFAEAHGDYLSAANHRTRLTDEPRHMALGVAVLKAMLADDPANLVILQRWQDEFAPLIRGFVAASRPMERIPGSDFRADAMWASIVEHHMQNAAKYGLRPTLTVDMI